MTERVLPLLDGVGISAEAARLLPLEVTWAVEEEIYGEADYRGWEDMSPAGLAGGRLQLAYMGGKAIEAVEAARGEHVTVNRVSRSGLCQLRVVRLGRPVDAEHYLGLAPADAQAWAWVDRRSGQDVHTLWLLWS